MSESVLDRAPARPVASDQVSVYHVGEVFVAEPVAGGAAYEIFTDRPRPRFVPNPRPGNPPPYRRFVHATEATVLAGTAPAHPDQPMTMPLSRTITWMDVHRLSQDPAGHPHPLLAMVRLSAEILPGTMMMKALSARPVAGYLSGGAPRGFCYREYDVAHLRTPEDLGMLRTDGRDADASVVFALRWPAIDPVDYTPATSSRQPGLVFLPASDKLGAPVLGTGFAPSAWQLIPEFLTADLADLPLPARAELVAFTADGTEVILYRYITEQRAWMRFAGPQWRRVLKLIPDVVPDQEFFPVPGVSTRILGRRGGEEVEVVADPPNGFIVKALTRSARFAVEAPIRRTPMVRWQGRTCLLVGEDGQWLRVRLPRPDIAAISELKATCVERGIYEAWIPVADATAADDLVVRYP